MSSVDVKQIVPPAAFTEAVNKMKAEKSSRVPDLETAANEYVRRWQETHESEMDTITEQKKDLMSKRMIAEFLDVITDPGAGRMLIFDAAEASHLRQELGVTPEELEEMHRSVESMG